MNTRSDVWTEGRLADLRRLWSEGASITQIGRSIGVSRNAVISKARRMKLPKRAQSESLAKASAARHAGAGRRKTDREPAAGWAGAAMLALPRGACRWPIGDPRSSSFSFCGGPAAAGRSYCDEHCARAYTTYGKREGAEGVAPVGDLPGDKGGRWRAA